MTDAKETLNKEESLKLILEIQKEHADFVFASKSFDGNSKIAIQELKELKTLITTGTDALNDSISKADKKINRLDSLTSAMAMIPEKLNDQLKTLPQNIDSKLKESVPYLSEAICKNVSEQISDSVENFKHYTQEIMLNTTTATTQTLQKIKGDADQLQHDMKHQLLVHTEGFDKIIDRSDQFRMRRFFLTTLFCGTFSAMVSAITTWYMIVHGSFL